MYAVCEGESGKNFSFISKDDPLRASDKPRTHCRKLLSMIVRSVDNERSTTTCSTMSACHTIAIHKYNKSAPRPMLTHRHRCRLALDEVGCALQSFDNRSLQQPFSKTDLAVPQRRCPQHRCDRCHWQIGKAHWYEFYSETSIRNCIIRRLTIPTQSSHVAARTEYVDQRVMNDGMTCRSCPLTMRCHHLCRDTEHPPRTSGMIYMHQV